MLTTTKSRVVTGVIALFVLLAAAAVAVYVYFGSHALPGTTVSGHPVGGQTREQVATTIDQLKANQVVTVDGGDTQVQVDMAQAGVGVDTAATVNAVFQANKDMVSRMTGLFGGHDVQPVTAVDQEKLDAYVSSLEHGDQTAAVDAAVNFDAAAGKFVVSPAAEGLVVDTAVLEEGIVAAAENFDDASIFMETEVAVPHYTNEAAQVAADQANQRLSLNIKASDGADTVWFASPETLASWTKLVANDGTFKVEADREAIRAWVSEFAEESKLEPKPGVQNVNSAGTVVATPVAGNPGKAVSNIDSVVDQIATALNSGTEYLGEFEYQVTDQSFEQRLIADGAENLAYMAAPGEKWIDVNHSTYQVTAYEGATAVMQIPMVPGATQYPTPLGTWAIYAKIPLQTMRGDLINGEKYETPDVPWILYYDGGYALHGAYWRSSFGFHAGEFGSRGCTNMPVDQAKILYDWADVGNVVVAHK